MAYITTAERIGIQKGLEKGVQKGLQKGKIEGKIEMMLEIKFDKQGQELMKKIHKISDLKQLNTILQKIKEARDISEI